jgi:hypothetical protein
VGAIIGAAIASITSAAVLLLPNPASADVEVTIENGVVEVRLTDLSSTPEEVVDALRDNGLNAEVDSLPTGPSNVGRFVAAYTTGGGINIERLDPRGGSFSGFQLPVDWPGTLTLSLGRAADGGEPYQAFSNPFGPDEPLRCANVFGQTLRDAADELDRFTASVHVLRAGVLAEQLTLQKALTSDLGTWVITGGQAVSATHVLLEVEQVGVSAELGC